jgi:hypothetical protein
MTRMGPALVAAGAAPREGSCGGWVQARTPGGPTRKEDAGGPVAFSSQAPPGRNGDLR